MILDTIHLENFGVYRGAQAVTLTPDGHGRPIVLFGGLNGCGKTTFLDAIQLALFGAKARCSNRGRLSYKDYLRTAIHRGIDPASGASVALAFRRMIDGKMRSYHVSRSWRVTRSGVQENVESTIDGRPDLLLTEHWDEFVESYIPSAISHLFFFDAEQIKDLAENERSAELIGTAISSLLGLELITQLETDLLALERRKKLSNKGTHELGRLRAAEQEVDRFDLMLEQVTQEKAHLATDADVLRKELLSRETQFDREGGNLYRRRKQLENDLAALERELESEERGLRHLLSGPAPLTIIIPLLQTIEAQARIETAARKAALVQDILEHRDKALLQELAKRKFTSKCIATIDALLCEERKGRDRKTRAASQWLLADDHLGSHIRQLRLRTLPQISSEIRTRSRARANIKERMSRIESTLARVPEGETFTQIEREMELLRAACRQKDAELEAADARLGVILQQRQAAEKRVEALLNEHATSLFATEDSERTVKHAAKVRVTLVQLRKTLVAKHAARVERLMFDSFTQLLRKGGLVGGVKVDPETYQIRLSDTNGRDLPFDRLSAGERQLLATSLLWGLARASGRPLPTIIDTPLGRLDSSHRNHLVGRYFPIASHQVILLSTDKEIDEVSLQQLRPYIGRSYRLEFDEPTDSTVVRPGYFWEYEAAC